MIIIYVQHNIIEHNIDNITNYTNVSSYRNGIYAYCITSYR